MTAEMNTPPSPGLLQLLTESDDLGKRLDVFVAENALGTSRSKIKLAIRHGLVTVNGHVAKASFQLRPNQSVVANLTELESLRADEPQAEDIPLTIVFEDDDIIAIDKPAGMVVHPAKGHWTGTLTAALVNHFQQLSSLGGPQRPGIVHRLDRDTSGVIVIAKNDRAHLRLTKQFERRSVEKQYLAVVSPPPDRDRDHVDKPIGNHPYQREKMAIRDVSAGGKPAHTFFEVVERIGRFALVRLFPKTGRTHQIRIHLTHLGSPVLADRLYSGRSKITEGWIDSGVDSGPVLLARQALHAKSITFVHPSSQEPMNIQVPLPADIVALIDYIRAQAAANPISAREISGDSRRP